MSHQNDEAERLRRLSEQQIRARDPRQADLRREAVVSQRPRETFSMQTDSWLAELFLQAG